MRVLIISDTHGDTDNFDLLLEKERNIDMVIHCGDGARDFDYIEERSRCSFRCVRGNCDLLCRVRDSISFELEGHGIYVEHGLHISNMNLRELREFGEFNRVDVIMYGHTHRQRIEKTDGLWIVNPGSLSRPRDGYPSYAILETDGQGNITVKGERL